MTDPKWVHIVENELRGCLTNFIVNDSNDYQKLKALMNEVIPRNVPVEQQPPILVCKFRQQVMCNSLSSMFFYR